MKEMKVSATIGVAVTVLAVVTALAFSFATVSHQSEIAKLKKVNQEYRMTLEEYRAILENIKKQVSEVGATAK